MVNYETQHDHINHSTNASYTKDGFFFLVFFLDNICDAIRENNGCSVAERQVSALLKARPSTIILPCYYIGVNFPRMMQ